MAMNKVLNSTVNEYIYIYIYILYIYIPAEGSEDIYKISDKYKLPKKWW